MLSASAEGTSERKAVKKIVAGTRLLIVLSLDGADFGFVELGLLYLGMLLYPNCVRRRKNASIPANALI